MKIVLRQMEVQGSARWKLLCPDAAAALSSVDKETSGLLCYKEMWQDAVSSLLSRRLRKERPLPGYSANNYGLAVDLDLSNSAICYRDILEAMKKYGWYCYRRDGEMKAGYERFLFVGDLVEKYLRLSTYDPGTWDLPAELRIYDLYGTQFQITLPEAQKLLVKAGFYTAPVNGERDQYFRESLMAFQRAWGLSESGTLDTTTCRVLSFITAEQELRSI